MVGLRKEVATGASRTNATLNPGHSQGWCGIDGAFSDSVHSPSLLSPDGAYAGVTLRSQGSTRLGRANNTVEFHYHVASTSMNDDGAAPVAPLFIVCEGKMS